MSVFKVGVRIPDDLARDEPPVYSAYSSDTGMEYELHECTDGIGALIGSSHEDIGQVTWWRAVSLEEGMAWIDSQINPPPLCPGSGRIVAAHRVRRGIYTDKWQTFCPHHGGAAPFAIAEPHPAGGYLRRYLEHPLPQQKENAA